MNKGRSFLSVLTGLLFFLFLRFDSWLCSLPAWLTLILHFTVGLSIWWFWGTLFVWIAAGILRYLLILFGRWGASGKEPVKPNKNPYSAKDPAPSEIPPAPSSKDAVSSDKTANDYCKSSAKNIINGGKNDASGKGDPPDGI